MIFIGHRPEEVASLRRPRQFFILRGIQFITASVFLVCLVNAATRLSQNGRGLFARSFLVTVAVSLIGEIVIGGLATIATFLLAVLAILQCQYDSFVAIHRPKRTRRIILLQSITDTLMSTLWLATFLQMLLISRFRRLYASDVTHATALSWYFADGFAGLSWLLFLYTALLLASSLFMFRTTRTELQPKALPTEPLN